jgi:hypothetical protein
MTRTPPDLAHRNWILAIAAQADMPRGRASAWNLAFAAGLAVAALVAHIGGLAWSTLGLIAGGVAAVIVAVIARTLRVAPARTRQERARIAGLVAVDRPGIRAELAAEHAAYGCQWEYRGGGVRVCAFGHSEALVPAEPVEVAA